MSAPLEWAALWAAMRTEPHPWILTTEAMNDAMLNALPPRAGGYGCFLVGEADHHNSEGRAVYAAFVQRGEQFFAKYMTILEFQKGGFSI